MAAPVASRPEVLKQSQAVAGKMELTQLQRDYVEYYIKTMERVIEKGEAYVKKVGARGRREGNVMGRAFVVRAGEHTLGRGARGR